MPQGESKIELWLEDKDGYRQLKKWDNFNVSGGKGKGSQALPSGEVVVFETNEVQKLTWDTLRKKSIGQEANYWRLKRVMEETRVTVVYPGGKRIRYSGYVSNFGESVSNGQPIKGQVEFTVDDVEELR